MVAGQVVQVLVATQAKEVYEILKTRDDARYEIALHTGTIKQLLPKAQLVIIDYQDIVEYPLTEAELREELFAVRIPECSSEDFLANPDHYLGGVTLSRPGKMLGLPPKYCVAFVSYSGGTGRTTLALDTAFYYCATMKAYKEKHKSKAQEQEAQSKEASAILLEFTYGLSSLIALTGLELPSLYQLATQPDVPEPKYKGVTLIPMDYDNVRMLPIDLLQRYLSQQMDLHTLAVVDCIWPHGLIGAVAERVDLWVVVASDRPDTIVNARRLHDELSKEYPEDKVWLLLNQSPKAAENRAASEVQWDIKLPRVARPDDYRGDLGREVLSHVFAPAWEEYDKSRKPGRPGKAQVRA